MGQRERIFRFSLEMIVGPVENIFAVPLLPGQGMEAYLAKIAHVLEAKDSEAILLVDLFGGTPSNCAASLFSQCQYNVEVVSGVNLPMLIEATQIRGALTGRELRQRLIDAGRGGIRDVVYELSRHED